MRPLLLLVLLLNALAADPQAEWPQFRGPNAAGVAANGAAPPFEFGPAKNLLWSTVVPAGHSSPVVSGERLFLTAFDPDSQKLELLCLNTKSGAILWRHTAPAPSIEVTHPVSNPATASPLLDSQRVYAYFSSYGLMAFNFSGDPQWTLPLPMPKTNHGSGASPILAGELLILNHDGKQDGYLLAVDRHTGKEVWKQPYPAQPGRVESYSTPVVYKDQLVLHRAGVVEAYEITTGKQSWSIPTSTSGASTPTVTSDTIYVATWTNFGEGDQRPSLPDFATLLKKHDKNADGAVQEAEFPDDMITAGRPELEAVPRSQNYAAFRQVDSNKDGIIQESEWETYRTRLASRVTDHGLLAIRPMGDKATVIWREKTSIPEIPSPLLYQGRLYLIRNGGIATCLDAATGKLIYRGRVGAPGPYFASPIAAAGRVYLASSEGAVTVLAAGKDQLQVLAQSDLGDSIVATPAITADVIYVRAAKRLYAFKAKQR